MVAVGKEKVRAAAIFINSEEEESPRFSWIGFVENENNFNF